MKSFREFSQQSIMTENIIRKGAVSTFALQGKRHGDAAVRSFQSARDATKNSLQDSNINERLSEIEIAINLIATGLIEVRHQIGSVSSQITSGFVA